MDEMEAEGSDGGKEQNYLHMLGWKARHCLVHAVLSSHSCSFITLKGPGMHMDDILPSPPALLLRCSYMTENL